MFSKDICCEHCIKGVDFWLDVSRSQGDQLMRNFIIFVYETAEDSFEGKTEMYQAFAKMFGGSSINKYDYKDVIDKAFKIGLISIKKKGSKRRRICQANDIILMKISKEE